MKFSELDIKQQHKLSLEQMRITTPTPVQEGSLPILLEGKDIVARAKTGSGKTIAFLLPIFQKMTGERAAQALILAPTRELVQQISKECRKLDASVKSVEVYGGVSINPQIDKLDRGAQVIIATPGRMIDHLKRGTADFQTLKFVVLDEADRMFEMGFIDDIKFILGKTPSAKQTMLFSATMPEAVIQIADHYMNKAERLMLDQDEITVNKIRQVCYGVDKREKFSALLKMLRKNQIRRGLIFVNTKTWADTLTKMLRSRNFRADSLHSNMSQKRRTQVMDAFKAGKFGILVATDVAARGLHIDGVTHVFNYDLPRNPKDYVHRIGRTGRAGAEGDAVSLLTQQDEVLLRGVEREIQMFLHIQPIDQAFDGTIQAIHLEQMSSEELEKLGPSEQVIPQSQQIAVEAVAESGGWDRWD